jgi:hypothetical protein
VCRREDATYAKVFQKLDCRIHAISLTNKTNVYNRDARRNFRRDCDRFIGASRDTDNGNTGIFKSFFQLTSYKEIVLNNKDAIGCLSTGIPTEGLRPPGRSAPRVFAS